MTESALETTPRRRVSSVVIFGIIGLAIVAILVVLALAVRSRGAPPLESGSAPNFSLTTFDGQTYKLSDLKGRPVVINFWASWCIPCRDEAPGLQRTWQTYKDRGLLVIGVDYVDTDADAKKFIAEFQQNYPNGADLGTHISQAFHITGVPETYFIDKEGKLLQGIDDQGRVKANFIGPLPEDVLVQRVEDLLKQ